MASSPQVVRYYSQESKGNEPSTRRHAQKTEDQNASRSWERDDHIKRPDLICDKIREDSTK